MVWVLTAQFPTTCQAPLACPCCRGGPQGWLTQHVSNCRRTSISPMTTTSLTSGLPQRRSPEGITPSSLTSGPSGFSSMRFSAGVRCPIQVLGPKLLQDWSTFKQNCYNILVGFQNSFLGDRLNFLGRLFLDVLSVNALNRK